MFQAYLKLSYRCFQFLTIGLFALWPLQSTANTDGRVSELEANLNTIQETNKAGSHSQSKIDGIHEQTMALLQEFKDASERLHRYQVNIELLQQIQDRQTNKEASLKSQIARVSETETALVPMLINMVDALEGLIKQDMPFLMDERLNRISTLRQMITSPELSLPEKYRQVLDAYEIEREFGYTIETYPKEIELDNTDVRVSILRIGRIGIYFQSKDGLQQGVWDLKGQQWKRLPAEYYSVIKSGINMASEESVPQLLELPLFSENIMSQLQAENTPHADTTVMKGSL